MKVSFNKKYVKTLTKHQFVKKFKDVFPDLDLEKEYEKIVPPKKKAEKEEK